jgi:hypothetical protein
VAGRNWRQVGLEVSEVLNHFQAGRPVRRTPDHRADTAVWRA